MKKMFLVLIVTLAASVAAADPLVLIPRGTTLHTGQFRAEAALSPDNDEGSYYWLGAGFRQWEVSAIRFDPPTGDDENVYSVQWNFLPETFITPAVSFGFRDIADESDQGLAVYGALTKSLTVPPGLSWLVRDISATAGIGIGGLEGPFAGLEVRLPGNFVAQGEYDTDDFNASLAWEPVRFVRLKVYSIRDEFYYGVQVASLRF